ncbi:MAG: low molecular weight phosphotyrosine protein phosphatase [Holophaga sp.]|nr:low molecular weight phosphotyrosine protein phosphatase [Holophaga sp.]
MELTAAPRSILVLCEGNHCRSPIAAALLSHALGSVRVESAGLAAQEGCPPHPEAVRLMAALGLDISAHAGRRLTPATALAADLILVMDRGQKDWCERLVPSVKGRVFLLGHWQRPSPLEIADPFGQGPEAFQAAFQDITHCVRAWLPRVSLERIPV